MSASERRPRRPVLLALAAGAALCAPAALADPSPRPERALVVLLDPRGPTTNGSGVQHALSRLRRAVDEIGAAAPAVAELASRRDARIDPSVLSSAIALRERAEGHFRVLQSDRALLLLDEATPLHMRRFPDVFGDAEASRAARLAAAIYRMENRPVRMREELRRAITFAPDAPMDPAQFPPELVAAFEAERQYLLAAGLPMSGPTRLCEAGRLIGAAVIVTIAPAATTANSVALDVYETTACERRAVSLSLLATDEEARRTASAILVPPAAVVAETIVMVRPNGPEPIRPPAEAPTPWWGRWYTIAGAGALVVGGVVSALLLTQRADGTSSTHTVPGGFVGAGAGTNEE